MSAKESAQRKLQETEERAERALPVDEKIIEANTNEIKRVEDKLTILRVRDPCLRDAIHVHVLEATPCACRLTPMVTETTQADLKQLVAEEAADENIALEVLRFKQQGTEIRNRNNSHLQPGDEVEYKPITTIDSIACTADTGDLTPERLKARLNIQDRFHKMEAIKKKIETSEKILEFLNQQRIQLADLVITMVVHLRRKPGDNSRRRVSVGPASATKQKLLDDVVEYTLKLFPDLKTQFKGYRGPVGTLAGMFDAAMQSARADKKHVRFAPPLLNFCLSAVAKSPTAYRFLREACPMLPATTTLGTIRCGKRLMSVTHADVPRDRLLVDVTSRLRTSVAVGPQSEERVQGHGWVGTTSLPTHRHASKRTAVFRPNAARDIGERRGVLM
jgi:hypothetical protein